MFPKKCRSKRDIAYSLHPIFGNSGKSVQSLPSQSITVSWANAWRALVSLGCMGKKTEQAFSALCRLQENRWTGLKLVLMLIVCSGTVLFITYNYLPKSLRLTLFRGYESGEGTSFRCHDVLRDMLKGSWHQRKMTPQEEERMRLFHKRVREEEHHIPKGMQRADKRCGDVAVGSTGMLPYFKALCDPDGPTPCCYNHLCQNKSVQECACATCEDMRTPIQAEYAAWRTVDPSCQPQNWTVGAICRLLKNSTIHFIGDSFMRHFFTAFLLAARGNFETGAFRPGMTEDLRKRCSGLYMFTEKTCRLWVDNNTTICNGSVTVKFFCLWSTDHARQIQNAVLSLRNTTRSLAFFGIGFHNHLQVDPIKTHILRPILETLKSQNQTSPPHLLWAGVHQFGMLKSALLTRNNTAVKAYNKAIQKYLHLYNVSMFDTYNLTSNMMSFDGTHYGYGVNIVKVNIFLHYLQELISLEKW